MCCLVKTIYFYISDTQLTLKKGLIIIIQEEQKVLPQDDRYNLFFCEYYLFEFDARKRELYFKTTSGKKALKFMLNKTFDTLGYKGSKIEMGYDE